VLSIFADACEYRTRDGTCFGKDVREKFFYFADKFINFNHGSFGAVAKPVYEKQTELFLKQEAYPDTWFRKQMYDFIYDSRAMIADFVKASVNDTVLVENASSAVNSILRSLQFQKGDKVIRLDTSYNMVVRTLDYLAETVGIQVIVVKVPIPITSPSQLLDELKTALTEHSDVKLSVFSHISSFPSIVEPLMEMSQLVHELAPNSLILVDGAHTPGVLLDLDVPSYNVDFYLGNCHKWLYAPKGTAFLWVSASQHESSTFPEPTVISSYPAQNFVERYSYTGTRDYTAFAALPAAFRFRQFLGDEEQIITYCHNLAVQAGRLLAELWGTNLLVSEKMSGFMVNVILPSTNRTAIEEMQAALNSTYNIYLVAGPATSFVPSFNENPASAETLKEDCTESDMDCDSTMFITRLSAQVYLELSDFARLGELVLQLLSAGKNKQSRVELSSS
jgi:isopenicillin-N epimerase